MKLPTHQISLWLRQTRPFAFRASPGLKRRWKGAFDKLAYSWQRDGVVIRTVSRFAAYSLSRTPARDRRYSFAVELPNVPAATSTTGFPLTVRLFMQYKLPKDSMWYPEQELEQEQNGLVSDLLTRVEGKAQGAKK
jgi:hypothetical protein